jgi:hypothetical protein
MRAIQPGEQIFVSYTGDNNIADTWEEIFKCKCYCCVCLGTCVNSDHQSTSEKTQEEGRESQHGIVDSVKDGPGRTQHQIMEATVEQQRPGIWRLTTPLLINRDHKIRPRFTSGAPKIKRIKGQGHNPRRVPSTSHRRRGRH